MLTVENIKVFNIEGALRGLRNPKNSWSKSDSQYGLTDLSWGSEELSDGIFRYLESMGLGEDFEDSQKAAERLAKEEKISTWLDINGLHPSFLHEDDLSEYNFIGPNDLKLAQTMIGAGTDESKFMRQIFISMDITAPLYWWKEFDTYKVGTVADSCSTMHKIASEPITRSSFSFDADIATDIPEGYDYEETIDTIIQECEYLRQLYVETKNKFFWRLLIQILPSGWMQKRTVTLNYQVARAMYFARHNHKLTEWHVICDVFEHLPYGKDLICYEKPKRLPAFLVKILNTLRIKTTDENHKEKTPEAILTDIEDLAKAMTVITNIVNENKKENKNEN